MVSRCRLRCCHAPITDCTKPAVTAAWAQVRESANVDRPVQSRGWGAPTLVGQTGTQRHDPRVPLSCGVQVWHEGKFIEHARVLNAYQLLRAASTPGHVGALGIAAQSTPATGANETVLPTTLLEVFSARPTS